MTKMAFSWDPGKAKENLRKHRVSFEEGSTLFFDENGIEFFDPDHSGDEERFLMLGLSCRLRILVVSYCLRREGSEIRVVSARKATRREQRVYTREKR